MLEYLIIDGVYIFSGRIYWYLILIDKQEHEMTGDRQMMMR
jgi:hypothetical protein